MYKSSENISEFIQRNIENHSSDISTLVAREFGISRQRASVYISREVKNGNLIKVGENRWTRYFLAGGSYIEFSLKIKKDLAEDRVWAKYIKPMLVKYPKNLSDICAYGFTEILYNAIDHSMGSVIDIQVSITENEVIIKIIDNGIGIFRKIQKALDLESIRESLLHLSKGKFTTDPSNHSGEGIFFTSRIFNKFSILSDTLYYVFEDEDWFLSSEKTEGFGKGTSVKMIVNIETKKTIKEVMDQYADQDIGFTKTIVAVALSADPNDPHVSRSQAKRLLMGLEKFKTVILDFEGVISVGQAFVDQVFRVFKNEHPHIKMYYTQTNPQVKSMIQRGAPESKELAEVEKL